MNPIAKMLIDMAKFYSYELESRQLEMYVGVLSQFPQEAVLKAGRDYVHNLKNTKFPIPPHSIMAEFLPKEASPEHLAKEAAGRILQAVSKFGWPNPNEAQAFIGELGWRVVERFGGWSTVCANLGVSMSTDTFYAQARDLCRSTLELGAAGIHDQPIGLEAPKGNVLSLVQSLADKKKLDGGKNENS